VNQSGAGDWAGAIDKSSDFDSTKPTKVLATNLLGCYNPSVIALSTGQKTEPSFPNRFDTVKT